MKECLRIATRSSQLALWQAEHIAGRIRELDASQQVDLVHVSTQGDRDQSEPLRDFGGLGVFTREVQRAVLDGRADLAVHSLKDLPTESVAGLVLAAVPAREQIDDVLVLPADSSWKPVPGRRLQDLPAVWRVGTGSPRRQAQLSYLQPGWKMSEVRGNVGTRLRKLDDGDYDALILAAAGLRRLGLQDRISMPLSPPLLLPAVSQGALGIECRHDDFDLREKLVAINHEQTFAAVTAERALLSDLRAGCHAPLGAHTLFRAGNSITVDAVVLNLAGTTRISASITGPVSDAESLGRELAEKLRSLGAARLIETSSPA